MYLANALTSVCSLGFFSAINLSTNLRNFYENTKESYFRMFVFFSYFRSHYFLGSSLAAVVARLSASAAANASSFAILPPCLVNFRVGANSPSLWPTMFSEGITVIKFLPWWTRKVMPTISGKIVESRDQVLI